MTSTNYNSEVIILGAGINGCGIARELAMNGKTVAVIDKSTRKRYIIKIFKINSWWITLFGNSSIQSSP